MEQSLVLRQIDGDIYTILPVISLTCNEQGINLKQLIDSALRKKNFAPRWNGDYLEEILESHQIARGLFGTKKIGILYFINDSEPRVPIGEYITKRGDKIEVVYTGISDS